MEFKGYLTLDASLSLEDAFAEYSHHEVVEEDRNYTTVPFLGCYDGFVRYYVWYRIYYRDVYYMAAKKLRGEYDRHRCNCYRCSLNPYNPLRSLLSPYTTDCLFIGELATTHRLEEVKRKGKKNVYAQITELLLLLLLLYLVW